MDLQNVKKMLKKWERSFFETHERKPGRDDIQQAPNRIKDAYACYQELKTASNRQPSEPSGDVGKTGLPGGKEDGTSENDFWGEHLNKSASSDDDKEKRTNMKVKEESALEKISRKMRKNMIKFQSPDRSRMNGISQFKSSSKSRDAAAEINKGNKGAISKGSETELCTDGNHSNTVSSDIFSGKVVTVKPPIKSTKADHTDIFQARRLKPLNRRRAVETDWLRQCAKDLDDLNGKRKPLPLDFDEKLSGNDATSIEDGSEASADVCQDFNQSQSGNTGKVVTVDSLLDQTSSTEKSQSVVEEKIDCGATAIFQCEELSEANAFGSSFSGSISLPEKGMELSHVNGGGSSPKQRFFLEKEPDHEEREEFANSSEGNADLSRCDSQSSHIYKEGLVGNPSETVKETQGSSNHAGHKRKLPSTNSSPKTERTTGLSLLDLNDDFEYAEEVAEIVENEEFDEGEDGKVEDVQRKAKRRRIQSSASVTSLPSSKSSSGLNQNFVRLNMKRKTYVRKGAKMKGEAYKRFMWKQRNKGGGGGGWSGQGKFQSKGQDKCFKCGQQGHWASQCNGFQKKKAVEVDDSPPDGGELTPFPSLEEAAMKAAGIRPDTETAQSFSLDTILPPVYDEPMPPSAMEPLYPLGPDRKPIEPPEDVLKALEKLGFSSFRTGQKQAIMNILSGLSTLLILSTGSGKSLCYQLPAYMYSQRSQCITLVISPLVSLMEDQIQGLPGCLRGARLHSHLTKTQREKVMKEVSEGRIEVLLMSPEALVCSGGRSLLNSSKMPPVAFACIDEAHCLSEWSHNFRPSYLMLCKVLRQQFGVRCILGLTATATKSTAKNVVEHFGIDGVLGSVVRGPSMPSNLVLCVSRDVNKERALVDLLQSSTFANLDSIIIYCIRREQTEKVASLIRTCLQDLQLKQTGLKEDEGGEEDEGKEKGGKKRGKKKRSRKGTARPPTNSAEAYHAGMSNMARKKVQNAFMAGNLRIVVATVAFGMGLDKQDVRGVIHFCLPRSFESYVQEVGRSGRDGKKSVCHLFLDSKGEDLCELRKHVYSNSVDRFTIKKLVKRIFRPCKCLQIKKSEFEEDTEIPVEENKRGRERACQGHEHTLVLETTVNDLDIKEEGIETLLCYLELHPHRLIRVLPNTWSTCTIHCYGGPKQLRQLAQTSPVVAAAVAKERQKGKAMDSASSITFEVVEVASSMGWNLAPVRREIKQLQWKQEPGKGWQKTSVMVEFSDLGFHFISPGDLSDDEIDDVVTFLTERVEGQVKRELHQLKSIFTSMHQLSEEVATDCDASETSETNLELKKILRGYFEHSDDVVGQNLQFPNWEDLSLQQMECSEGTIRADIRNFIGIHHDRDFTGRAVARIFQGIASPVYPAQVWGKDRRFWRCHLNADFMRLVKLANEELRGIR